MNYHIKDKQGNIVASFKYEYDRDHFFAMCDKPDDRCEKEDTVKS